MLSERGCGQATRSKSGGGDWLCSRPSGHHGLHVAESWSRGRKRTPQAVWGDEAWQLERDQLSGILEAVQAARNNE